MKANELMIGDWVKITEPAIKGDYQVKEIKDNDGLGIVVGHYFMWGDYIQPTPLTAEILEKNEYKHCSEFVWLLKEQPRLDEGLMGVGIDSECGTGFCIMPEGILTYFCKYVHELQHALRLCRLNELADNFKI